MLACCALRRPPKVFESIKVDQRLAILRVGIHLHNINECREDGGEGYTLFSTGMGGLSKILAGPGSVPRDETEGIRCSI
jgi:hypothetical protein